jgi:hypothetical protein
MATDPAPVTSVPDMPGQPYDAAAPDGSALGQWVKVTSGPCDMQGTVRGDWPSDSPWRQT